MDEIEKIKLLIDRSILLFEKGEEQTHKLSSDELMRLIELVEEAQVENCIQSYFAEPIEEDYENPKRVSEQLTEQPLKHTS